MARTKDFALWATFDESDCFIYKVSEEGNILAFSKKTFREFGRAIYKRRNSAAFKANNKEYILKCLVAKHFISEYKQGDFVICKDGDEMNCSVNNLKVVSRSEYGKQTGALSKSKVITVYYPDGKKKVFQSASAVAREFYVHRQTILDYLSKDRHPKRGIFEGYKFERE